MKKTMKATVVLLVLSLLMAIGVQAQNPAKKMPDQPQASVVQATNTPVSGSGLPGRLSKWTGIDGTNTYVLGNSAITENKFGKIGIGTTTPTSPLTVRGVIETTLGGFKFPDGTAQTTAAIASVTHDATLTGNGTAASPLGIAAGGVNTTQLANNAVTTPKIADAAVTSAKIADAAVTTPKIADAAVTTSKIADTAVTSAKISNGTVVRNLNGLTENVTIAAGTNISVSAAGNTITVAAPNTLTGVAHDATLTGNGTQASPLSVAQGAGDASQPVQVTFDTTVSSGRSTSFIVPDGKRFVIEYVGASITKPTSANIQPMDGLQIRTQIGSTSAAHILVSYRVESGSSFTTHYAGQIVKFYADPGTEVYALFSTNASSFLITLSGHYVDVP